MPRFLARALLLCHLPVLGACADLSANSDHDAGIPSPARDAATTGDAGVPTDGGSSGGADGGDGGAVGYKRLPCTVMVGTGTGDLTLDATTAKSKDVVCIKSGTYTSASFRGMTDVTLQNDGGLVKFAGHMEIANLTDVTFAGAGDAALSYGFQLSGPSATFQITGPNSGLTIHSLEAVGAGIVLDAGHTDLVWNGQPSTLVLYRSKVDHVHLKESGQLFQGNYGALSDLKNFASDFEISNVVVEDSKGTGQNVVNGGGIFNLNVHDWTITGKNNVALGSGDDRDVGVFSIYGSGSFKRMHRVGGWGWLVRTFGVQLGATPGELHCEDNVDIGTQYYGTCEIRNDESQEAGGSYLIPGKLSTVAVFVSGNVSAHKLDFKGSYTTASALVPFLKSGTTATIKNNLGCDNKEDAGAVNSVLLWNIQGTVVQSGNLATASCAGLKDPITGNVL